MKLVYNTSSGYVHGAYGHIMEAYDGQRYVTTGHMAGPRIEECEGTLVDYTFRALGAALVVAARCKDEDIRQRLKRAADHLISATGRVPSDEEMPKLRARMKKAPV